MLAVRLPGGVSLRVSLFWLPALLRFDSLFFFFNFQQSEEWRIENRCKGRNTTVSKGRGGLVVLRFQGVDEAEASE